MIWKRILPSQGGGPLRRFIQLNTELLQKKYPSLKPYTSTLLSSSPPETTTKQKQKYEEYENPPTPPLALFDFSRTNDANDAKTVEYGPTKGGWRVSDDSVIGGYSTASLEFMENGLSSNTSTNPATQEQQSSSSSSSEPFLRWKGNLNTKVGKQSKARKSGFCAMRSPECGVLPPVFYGVPLDSNYNGLEITCRTDGRLYTVNLKVSTFMPDDLYQGIITVPNQKNNDDWITLVIPFEDFVLTSFGLERVQQRKLDGGITFQHLGLTLMDEVNGPFQFDLKRVRAVNYHNGAILNDE